jgi:hypothetical protein
MTSPNLDAPTLTRLALIRLLHQQGIEQAGQPEPLSFFSLLMFHDSVELFLVLAADHLGAHLPRRDPGFLDYWQILRRTDDFPAGVNLTGQPAMDRLNRYRNALKHAGALPGRDAVQEARVTTASFFEDNTEAVFGVAFDAIDMADVVPQEDIRALLKSAATAEEGGHRKEAMAGLAMAFAKLFNPYVRSMRGPYGFGRMRLHSVASGAMGTALHTLAREARSNSASNLSKAGRKIDDNISQLNKAVSAIQRGMRVLALGIDYTRYTRFEQLTPTILRDDEQPMMIVDSDYAPTREEYDYCVQLVITTALRITEVGGNAVEPSWVRARVAGQRVESERVELPT